MFLYVRVWIIILLPTVCTMYTFAWVSKALEYKTCKNLGMAWKLPESKGETRTLQKLDK